MAGIERPVIVRDTRLSWILVPPEMWGTASAVQHLSAMVTTEECEQLQAMYRAA